MNYKNPIWASDFYKTGHKQQYPDGTQVVYSNFTPRGARIAIDNDRVLDDYDNKVVVLGLQAMIKEFLIDGFNQNFFEKDVSECQDYIDVMNASLGNGMVDVKQWHDLWKLGHLPLEIRALPEGSRAGVKIPQFTIINTDERFFWLTNYLETVISTEMWAASTSATLAFEYKRLCESMAEKTCDNNFHVPYQCHDFSFRGMNTLTAAVKSAIGHLVNFDGTDTIPAIPFLKQFYNAQGAVGVSVPATEHSVMCLGGKEDEIETFRRLIEDEYPTGIISIVSDTWDYFGIIEEGGTLSKLKEKILGRDGKVVIRPDSGNPVDIICGTMADREFDSLAAAQDNFQILHEDYASEECEGSHCMGNDVYTTKFLCNDQVYEATSNVEYGRHDKQYYFVESIDTSINTASLSPEEMGSIRCLWNEFGGTVNDKGYKVLNDKIGLIYGDSITLERAKVIMERLEAQGFASSNIVFGVGSYTYQYNTRDTFGFAMKATWGIVNGEEREIFKDPKTDGGTKKSAKGLLSVGKNSIGDYVLVDQCTKTEYRSGFLAKVFRNGELLVDEDWDTIKERLAKS